MSPHPAAAAPAARSPRRRRTAFLVSLVALGLVAAACSKKDPLTGPVVKDGVGCQPSEVDRRTDAPKTAATEVGKKVATKDLIAGKGCTPATTDYLSLDLVGAHAKDGKVFTSTWDTKHPITAQLGQGQLLAGLETGLKGMKVGTRRQITIPAKQAYGKDGNPDQGIGANEDLVFVADLISVTPNPVFCSSLQKLPAEGQDGKPVPADKPTTVDMPIEVPTDKVTTKVLRPGKGPKVGKKAYATVHYLGVSCVDGRQFDSSWDRGEPFTVALGTAPSVGQQGSPDYVGTVIPGWSQGLEQAQAGGRYQLEIPYSLAYGASGQPPTIAAKAALVFIVDVQKVSTKAPKATTTTTTTSTTAPAAGSTTTAPATTTTTGK